MPLLTETNKIEIGPLDLIQSINFPNLLRANELIITGDNFTTTTIPLNDLNSLKNLEFAESIEISGFENLEDCCFITQFFPDICNDITLNNGTNCDSYFNARESCDAIDPDGDGVYGSIIDNCPYIANPNQYDNDNDGIGNACDNCPLTSNSDQADSNNNYIGDACEVNNDAVIEASELRLTDPNRSIILTNENGDCYKLFIDLAGEIKTKIITCP